MVDAKVGETWRRHPNSIVDQGDWRIDFIDKHGNKHVTCVRSARGLSNGKHCVFSMENEHEWTFVLPSNLPLRMEGTASEPIALFDLDGTLADFPWAMRRALTEIAAPGEQAYFDEQDDEPPHVTARRRLIKRRPGFWRDLPPFHLGFDVLEMCRKLKFNVNVLTKAPKNNYPAWSEKAEWCSKHLGHFDHKITMTEDKGIVYGKVLIDDWPKYVGRWLDHRPRGLVIMPAHDYNVNFRHPNVIRYDGRNHVEVLGALEEKRKTCK